jgi:hypothetical protein
VSLAQYANRTYDVSAFQGVSLNQDALLDPSLAPLGLSGTICAGVQKLAQRFLLELLTRQGSAIYAPTRGTKFLTTIQSGQARTETDVFSAFSLAIGLIGQAFAGEVKPSDPLDERFAKAELAAIVFLPDRIKLTVELTTTAGTTRALILPIPLLA